MRILSGMEKIFKKGKCRFWKALLERYANRLVVEPFCDYVEQQKIEGLKRHQEMMSELKDVDESVWLVTGHLKREEDEKRKQPQKSYRARQLG